MVEGKVLQVEAVTKQRNGRCETSPENMRSSGGVLWSEHRVWVKYGRK